MKILKIVPAVMLLGLILVNCSPNNGWRTASRESSKIAPDPASTSEAILQVYGADTYGWRGWFAIHTWIAAKRTGEPAYTVYDVVGWRGRRGLPVLRIAQDIPDRYWYGEKPRIIKAYRGKGVDRLIDAVDKAAHAYPWQTIYKGFPGPNSNTFTAWIAKQVPELELELPFSAIGSGYVNRGKQHTLSLSSHVKEYSDNALARKSNENPHDISGLKCSGVFPAVDQQVLAGDEPGPGAAEKGA